MKRQIDETWVWNGAIAWVSGNDASVRLKIPFTPGVKAIDITGDKDLIVTELNRLRSIMAEIIHDLETTKPYKGE